MLFDCVLVKSGLVPVEHLTASVLFETLGPLGLCLDAHVRPATLNSQIHYGSI